MPDPTPRLKPATIAVKAGRPGHQPDNPFSVPVTFASTYVGDGALEYGRYANPTWTAFEDALGALEGGRCLSYASGLAAVAAVLELVPPGGLVVAPRHAYLGSLAQLAELERRGQLRVTLVDVADEPTLLGACADAALVWIETPTNPALEVVDLPFLIGAAHRAGATVAVDNTFATPLLQQPLALGADLVVHSVSKYIAGHSDVVMGAVATGSEELFGALKRRRDTIGAVPGPMEAWLALRGLRTLPLRLERAQENARELAGRLQGHPALAEVRYPGFGAVIAVVVAGGGVAADTFTHGSDVWVHATSLGGVESTFERRRRWKGEAASIPEGLVRLSVGVEDVEDLWDDLVRALDGLAGRIEA